MKRIGIVSALLLGASISMALTAGPRHHQGGQIRDVLKQLDLTSEQKQDIKQAFKQGKQDMRVYREDMRQIRQEMKSLIQTEQWQADAVAAVISQREALTGQLALTRVQNKHHVWNLLNEEQQQKFNDLTQDRQRTPREFDGLGKLEKLDLSEVQQEKLIEIKAQVQSLRENVRASRKAMKETEKSLVQSADFDVDAWQTLFNEQQQNMTEAAIQMAHARHLIWNMLTDEQQETLANSIKEKRHEKRHGKRHQDRI